MRNFLGDNDDPGYLSTNKGVLSAFDLTPIIPSIATFESDGFLQGEARPSTLA
jgi:hypothetical protein